MSRALRSGGFAVGVGSLMLSMAAAGYALDTGAFLKQHCALCHGPSVQTAELDVTSLGTVTGDRANWERILRVLASGQMPPPGQLQPEPAARNATTSWLREELKRADSLIEPNAGRVTARRLNREEYNRTIRDLFGVDLRPADDFPYDDPALGFDNIADALSLSPALMERYIGAAEKVVRFALFGPEKVEPTVVRHQPPYRFGLGLGDKSHLIPEFDFTITDYDLTGLSHPSALHTTHDFPADGIYDIRISPEGNRPRPSDPFEGVLWVDGKRIASVSFVASDAPTSMEGEDQHLRIHFTRGSHELAMAVPRLYEGLPAKYGGLNPTKKPPPPPPDFTPPPNATPEQIAELRKDFEKWQAKENKPALITDKRFWFNYIEITGPFEQDFGPDEGVLDRLLVCSQPGGDHNGQCAREILSNFAARAYRRPLKVSELDELVGLFESARSDGNSFKEALAVPLQAVLVMPDFLFRIERDPQPGERRRLDDHEFAGRLSYLLWSSMPDAKLSELADEGRLADPAILRAQVRRMVNDPKIEGFIKNFAGQWLQFRALESIEPDNILYPRFDHYLRRSMERETELLVENVVRSDRSVIEFVNANYSFLNERLGRYYGVAGVRGPQFRKVDLRDSPRRGVLGHGSVLTVSSYATRTSPVLRGKWVLENLLNAPPPPPPPNVPELEESTEDAPKSLRERLELHRRNPACASCHASMDPLGFGLENYDAIGRWRSHDGDVEIDPSGELPNGEAFAGPVDLVRIIASQEEAFVEGLTEKLMVYALGRGLELGDRPAIRKIVDQLKDDDYRFSSLLLGVVESLPFQYREAAQ